MTTPECGEKQCPAGMRGVEKPSAKSSTDHVQTCVPSEMKRDENLLRCLWFRDEVSTETHGDEDGNEPKHMLPVPEGKPSFSLWCWTPQQGNSWPEVWQGFSGALDTCVAEQAGTESTEHTQLKFIPSHWEQCRTSKAVRIHNPSERTLRKNRNMAANHTQHTHVYTYITCTHTAALHMCTYHTGTHHSAHTSTRTTHVHILHMSAPHMCAHITCTLQHNMQAHTTHIHMCTPHMCAHMHMHPHITHIPHTHVHTHTPYMHHTCTHHTTHIHTHAHTAGCLPMTEHTASVRFCQNNHT